MKKTTFKLVALLFGASVIVSSCLKTEELDSVKAMREAKVDNIIAGTARLNADAALADANAKYRLTEVNRAINQNRYDSANNSYILLTNKAISDYNVAVKAAEAARDVAIAAARAKGDVAYQLKLEAQYNADILVIAAKRDADIQYQNEELARYKDTEQQYLIATQQRIADAKNSLLIAQMTFIQYQEDLYEARLRAIADSIDASSNNPLLVDLNNDYGAYYNGYRTLSNGVYISEGIFALKQRVLDDKNTLLITNKANRENQVKTNNDQVLNYRDQIRTDSLAVVAENTLIGIYTNAKTAANYDAAIKSINDLLKIAEADFQQKEIQWKKQVELLNEATAAYTVAKDAYDGNLTAKTEAKKACEDILDLYTLVPSTTYEGFLVEKSKLSSKVTAKQNAYNTWKTKFDAALSALNLAKSQKNTAQVAKEAADAVVNAAIINGGSATQAQLDAQSTANTNLNTANNTLNDRQDEFDAIDSEYTNANTALKNAREANDSIVARDARYLISKDKYDAAVTAETGLKTTLDTKASAKNAQQLVVNTANTAQQNAKALYNTYNGGKVALEGLTLVTDNSIKISELDNEIVASQSAISLKNNDIADLKLKIARINDNLFKYDDEIALLNNKIAINQALINKYEAAAIAIKAKIDLL